VLIILDLSVNKKSKPGLVLMILFFIDGQLYFGPESKIYLGHPKKLLMKNVETIELQIREKQKIVDYDIKDSTVALLIQRYTEGVNKIYIPDYQSALVWDTKRQSKFIESVLLGLPR